MSDEEPAEEPVEDVADQAPPSEEPASDADPSETAVEEPEEERDPLEVALERADFAEKEIAYKEAEIQNVRKRLMADKAEALQYGGMGMEDYHDKMRELSYGMAKFFEKNPDVYRSKEQVLREEKETKEWLDNYNKESDKQIC